MSSNRGAIDRFIPQKFVVTSDESRTKGLRDKIVALKGHILYINKELQRLPDVSVSIESSHKAVMTEFVAEVTSLQKDQSAINAFAEFKDLSRSSGVEILDEISGKQDAPLASHFLKKGKIEEIRRSVEETCAEIVIFNHTLSPSQERNLENAFNVRVVDRTGLILDIFASRASTHIGKLQVELAQLTHLSTRLIRAWTHLERQKGGIGLRGPGETQLETDRRLIGHRIKNLKKRLDKAHNQKEINRYARKKGKDMVVGLVGYTNAGKTTLFNHLTQNSLYVAVSYTHLTLPTTPYV